MRLVLSVSTFGEWAYRRCRWRGLSPALAQKAADPSIRCAEANNDELMEL